MAIVKTLSFYDFEQDFKAIRPDNFSYEGLKSLYEYFDEYSEDCGEPFELDVIAICCDWAESDYLTIAQDYRIDLSDVDDNDDDAEEQKIQIVSEYLSDHTSTMQLPDDKTFVYQAF